MTWRAQGNMFIFTKTMLTYEIHTKNLYHTFLLNLFCSL